MNTVILRKEMGEGFNRSVYPEAQKIIYREFNKDKKQLLRSFKEAGPSEELAKLSEMGGEEMSEYRSRYVERGNLFAFFGFENGENPVEKVSDMLRDFTEIAHLSKGSINQQGVYVIKGRVEMPTLEDINTDNQLPWIDRGWIDGLTNGLRGLPNFLFADYSDNENSLSKAGLQAKRNGEAVNTGRGEFRPYEGKYLFEFIQDFKEKVRGQ